jgi:hypothetical protein
MKTKLHQILLAALLWGAMLLVTAPVACAIAEDDTPKAIVAEEELPFLEFQFSPIFSYAWGDIESFGYGIQAAVYPMENLGVQVDYLYFGDADTIAGSSTSCHAIGVSAIYRFADKTLEPYIIMGGGVLTSTATRASWHVGGGLNFWATETLALFAEVRYTWVGSSAGDPSLGDYPSVTVGGRWSF